MTASGSVVVASGAVVVAAGSAVVGAASVVGAGSGVAVVSAGWLVGGGDGASCVWQAVSIPTDSTAAIIAVRLTTTPPGVGARRSVRGGHRVRPVCRSKPQDPVVHR